ncbi:hypothetical protein [Paraburkholderia unamae]|uniref:Uncharacterized protein n=1 Tax=Paraburkholderia unamae TaxID=219649 RepID=A0ABX5KVJ6_9BURK|nr:hypothetical protein [Paraburkholderia unamae]PVX97694.1 hypothetical protein C7402_101408 [Paraburkholderia unamae]
MVDFTFAARFALNSVFIIDGLGPDDPVRGNHLLYEELRDLKMEFPDLLQHVDRCVVENGAQFLDTIREITEMSRALGLRPIVHIECHGTNDGLRVGARGELLPWPLLEPVLRQLNLATGCNLGVVMVVCHGLFSLQPVKITRPAPFYFLLGSQEELYSVDMRVEMPKFYRTLCETNDLDRAVTHVRSCKHFIAEHLVVHALGRLIKNACTGKGRTARVERAVTLATWQLAALPRDQRRERIRQVRKDAKATSLPDPLRLRDHFERFLPKREPGFRFQDLIDWAQGKH